ncbi:protein starmaker-like [Ptychodera flava]|uniref:protein starmaker-like n=1 Tax=Ptychodera flava TaxID=63121 RepID=UPI00396A733F
MRTNYSSSSASYSQDSQSDGGSDIDESGDHGDDSFRFKRVSFSTVLDSDTTDKELSSPRSTQHKGILKYSSPREKIMYTYPGAQPRSRTLDNDEIRKATTILSMLHIPATRLGLPRYDPSIDQSNRRVVTVRQKKFKRKVKPPPPICLSPGVPQTPSPRPPREVQHSDHKLADSGNPELLLWLKKKNALLRKQRREKLKKERQEKKAEQKETEKKIERMVEAEELYADWLKKTRKETLLTRRKQRQKKTAEEAMLEHQKAERDKRLQELKVKEAERKAAMAAKMKKKPSNAKGKANQGSETEVKEGERSPEDTKEGQGSEKSTKGTSAGQENVKSEEQGKENKMEETVANTKKTKRKCKNKVHPSSADPRGRSKTVRDPDGTLASNNDYVYRKPGKKGSTQDGSNPSLSRYQPKRKPNPMSKMSYDEWLQQKRKDENRQKLKEEVRKAKEVWSDPSLENIIPKLARERIEKATESKLKVDTGLKKSPRDRRSPSPSGKRPASASNESANGSATGNGKARNYTWKPEMDPRTESPKPSTAKPRLGSANGKPPTPPLSGRPGSGSRKTKSAPSKILKTERPEPQGCEITDEQKTDGGSQQNSSTTNEKTEGKSADDVAANQKPGEKSTDDDTANQKDTTVKDGVEDQLDKETSDTSGEKVNSKEDSGSTTPEKSQGTDGSQSDLKNGDQSENRDEKQETEDISQTGTDESEANNETTKTEENDEETPRSKSKVSFNLDENVNIPPPQSDAEKKMEDVLRTANLMDDFLRKESDNGTDEGKVSGTSDTTSQQDVQGGVFITETSEENST